MRNRPLIALAALALAAAGCRTETEASAGTVHRILDGGTMVLKTGEQVRLAGCDAPAKGRPGWGLGRNELQKLVGGRQVSIERQGRDRQGRTLARVRLYDGRDVADILISRGLARPRADDEPAEPGPGPTVETPAR